MPESKTKLYHTFPSEEPFECMTGDLSEGGLLITVDKRTHELVVEPEAEETITVRVNPKGVRVIPEC